MIYFFQYNYIALYFYAIAKEWKNPEAAARDIAFVARCLLYLSIFSFIMFSMDKLDAIPSKYSYEFLFLLVVGIAIDTILIKLSFYIRSLEQLKVDFLNFSQSKKKTYTIIAFVLPILMLILFFMILFWIRDVYFASMGWENI